MYSPFFDTKGKPIELNRVKYEHIEQLKEIDEGHHIEYKRLLEDGGKAQLAKEIASFANCEGGWLIVGIEDKTREVCPVEKIDYSQKIGKIVCRVTPIPEFETKFIVLPNDSSKGILLIYVYEGRNAPYICEGGIYIRSGSSKEPIKAAERGNIEYLQERSNGYQKQLENFFHRDIYLGEASILQRNGIPSINIFVKNVSQKKKTIFSIFNGRNKIIEFVKQEYPNVFENIQYSMDSIIFKNTSTKISANSYTFVFELFYDWSFKLCIPIGILDYDEIDDIKQQYIKMGMDENSVEKYNTIDGGYILNCVRLFFCIIQNLAKKFKLSPEDYAVACELENIADYILAFTGEEYMSYLKKHGNTYAHKEVNKSKVVFLKDYAKMNFMDVGDLVMMGFVAAAFGYDCSEVSEILDADNRKYTD